MTNNSKLTPGHSSQITAGETKTHQRGYPLERAVGVSSASAKRVNRTLLYHPYVGTYRSEPPATSESVLDCHRPVRFCIELRVYVERRLAYRTIRERQVLASTKDRRQARSFDDTLNRFSSSATRARYASKREDALRQ